MCVRWLLEYSLIFFLPSFDSEMAQEKRRVKPALAICAPVAGSSFYAQNPTACWWKMKGRGPVDVDMSKAPEARGWLRLIEAMASNRHGTRYMVVYISPNGERFCK